MKYIADILLHICLYIYIYTLRYCFWLRERVKAAVQFCSHPSRVAKYTRQVSINSNSFTSKSCHIFECPCWIIFSISFIHVFPFGRRDKYQSSIKEYWVDVETTGSYEDEQAEELVESTFAEGDAGQSFDLGLPSSEHLHGPGEEPEETDRELVSEDDGASTKTKVKVPGKMEAEREVALEVGSLDVHF